MNFRKKLAYLVPSIRRAADQDMQEELRSLQEMAGRHELGNLTLAAEDARSQLGWVWVERLVQDVRYGVRSMTRDKGFAFLVVVSLALGIGANTAIFSFMDSVLLRSLPVADPESLVVMKWQARGYALAQGMSWSTGGSTSDPTTGTVSSIFPYPALKLFQDSGGVLSSAFCYFAEQRLSVTVRDETDSLKGHYVSGNYFHGMGVAPAAGRLIQPADDEAGPAAVVVLSHRFSVRRFGAAQAAVGQGIRINDKPFSVVGVVPDAFFGAEPGAVPDIYIPMRAQLVIEPTMRASLYADEHFYWIEIMARLRSGVSRAQAQAVLAPAFRQFVASSASTETQMQDLPQLTLQGGSTGLDSLRRRYAQPIYVLMAMVGLILVIACSNVANLLLARSAARRREIAVRLSLGASRRRVIRQLLTESVLLSSIGGALGVAVAWWGIRVLTLLLANGRANFTLHAELNWHVLGLTLALSILTGLLFGLAPALQATRVDIAPALKGACGLETPGPARRVNLGFYLVVAQIALSLLLLVAAGLFGRTLSNLHAIELGFNRDQMLLFTIRPSTVGYQGPALAHLFEQVRERVGQLPGVKDVSLSGRPLPMGGGTIVQVALAGSQAASAVSVKAALASVGPNFFKTMQIPLLAGREFTDHDHATAPKVVVINRALARALGIASPTGQTLLLGPDQFEIVGVTEDALSFSLKEARRPALYLSYLQSARPAGQMTYEMRVAGDPVHLAALVRQTLRQVDSRIAIHDMTTQASHIDQAISSEITIARLCSVFAALALVIACVGLYGTIAFSVARRTGEIGIRSALGAPRGRIMWMVLRDVIVMSSAGLAIGIPLALAASIQVKSFLYGVEPNDPTAIGFAAVVMFASGLLAGFIPARRASRIDPLSAMRRE